MIIETAVYRQAMLRLQELYDGFGTAKDYERGLLILGETGTGKSLIAEEFEKRYPSYETEERIIRPVVRIVIDDPSIDGVLLTLLTAYGLPVTYSKKTKQMMDIAYRCINNARTHLLLIDEASQIAEHRGDKTVRKSGDFLKSVINKTQAAVACFGVGTLLALSTANKQFRERYAFKINTHVWGINQDSHEDFVAYAIEYASHKNIAIPASEASLPLLEAMLYATDGRVRKINHFIDTVARLFPSCEGEDLQRIFIQSFEDFSQSTNNARNPFHSSFNGKELTGPGELYAPEPLRF